MTDFRNDLGATGRGLVVLVAAVIGLATTTAAADDLDPKVDPMIAAIDAFIAELALDKSDEEWKSKVPVPGAMAAFDPEKTYYWNLETNRGDLKIELFPKSAPLQRIEHDLSHEAGLLRRLDFSPHRYRFRGARR